MTRTTLALFLAVVGTLAIGAPTLADPAAAPTPGPCVDRCEARYSADMAAANATYDSCVGYAAYCYAEWLYNAAAANLTHSDCIDTCYYLPGIQGAPIP